MKNEKKFGNFRIRKSKSAAQPTHTAVPDDYCGDGLFSLIVAGICSTLMLLVALAFLFVARPIDHRTANTSKAAAFEKHRTPANVDYFTFIQGTPSPASPATPLNAGPCSRAPVAALNF